MTTEEIAERHANERPGFDLVDYSEVGLPYWRIRARCEVLANKRISAIDETVLSAIDAEVDDPQDLAVLLGLDDVLLDSTVLGLLGEEWVRGSGDGRLALTDKGREVLRAAAEVVSREQVLPFDYDGLLRRPTLVEGALEPRQLAARGAREIPPHPARKPDLPELRQASAEIARLLRTLGDPRDQEANLLAIKSLDRRERIFRPAIALVYQPRAGGEVEVAFAVDEELSAEHERAFAKARLADRLGLDRELRRGRPAAPGEHLPKALRGQLEVGREAELRQRVTSAKRAAESPELSDAERQEADAELDAARRELAGLAVRTVETYEHPRFLEMALGASRRRLLVVSPWISDSVVDGAFLHRLEGRLRDGADVLLGYGIAETPEENIGRQAAEKLPRLAKQYSNFRFNHLGGGTHAKVLISDDNFVIITSFNWLSFRGDPNRTFRDERGVLLTQSEQIEEEWQRWAKKWPRRERPRGRSSSRARRSPRNRD